ncbi:tetratricopeptide repeat protein [Pendulispora albinea]|uniref:Tetratricopeptide repeat protein n=1 Tax=Pendulispora albinea TaxID=2741071 RepID=A0ABZ2LYP9_9BACT
MRFLVMLALPLAPAAFENAAHAQQQQQQQQQQQGENGLAAARKLFAEALRAEEKGNFAEALEKFRRVAQVKDTVPVRYRIAACLEGLGQLKEALRAYQAAIDLGAGDPKDLEVVRDAKRHTSSLGERIPQLTLTVSPRAPSSSEVRIDGDPLPVAELGKPIPLDPGTHDVTASAPDTVPFRTQITLPERARLSLLVPLDPKPAPKNEEHRTALPPPASPPSAITAPEAPAQTASSSSSSSARTTGGWIAVGAGAALLVGAGVTLALRQSDISKLEDACPNNVCPGEREDELSSIRSRAQAEGPIAGVLAGLGAVGIGVGTYILLSKPHPNASTGAGSNVNFLNGARGELRLGGRPAPGGGRLVLTTTF